MQGSNITAPFLLNHGTR